MSRAAIRRKSLQESRYKTLILLLDERSSGQNFLVNFLSLSLSLSLVCFSQKNICASLCGPFVLLLFRCFLRIASFSFTSSSLLPPQTNRESIIYIHLSNDDDAFFFCEDFPNGGGRYYQGTLKFSLSLVSRLRFCCRRLRRLVRILRSLFVCLGAEILFKG